MKNRLASYFLFAQIEKTDYLDGVTKIQRKTYSEYNEDQKGGCDVQKYDYELDRIAAEESGQHSRTYEVQKHILSEYNGTP